MTLPYDIARCAGGRDSHGCICRQCNVCARYAYSKPPNCHPHWQAWIDPHSLSGAGECPHFIHINQKAIDGI